MDPDGVPSSDGLGFRSGSEPGAGHVAVRDPLPGGELRGGITQVTHRLRWDGHLPVPPSVHGRYVRRELVGRAVEAGLLVEDGLHPIAADHGRELRVARDRRDVARLAGDALRVRRMARPPAPRKIVGRPVARLFKPGGAPAVAQVGMALDEFEAVRLADLEELEHAQAARRMGVSRQTRRRLRHSRPPDDRGLRPHLSCEGWARVGRPRIKRRMRNGPFE